MPLTTHAESANTCALMLPISTAQPPMQEANATACVDDRIRDALQTQAASTRAEFIRALDSQKTQLSDLSHVAAEVLHGRDQQVHTHPHQLPCLPHPTTV
jgi:hypothetical protein